MTFALTKIQLPRPRTGVIDREALETALAGALVSARVVVLCAPAGYGKTTLLARALARQTETHAVAWFSADEGDDLQNALECLLAALEPFDPPWRSAPETLLQRASASEAEMRSVAAELINTLEACDAERGIIAIDDLHRIEDPAWYRFLEALIDRIGARWSIALASRVDPPLALARLRAAGELVEFRQLQLRFAQAEAQRLASVRGIDPAQADRAFERTQGWPAGLGIALASARHHESPLARREGERSMLEYLLSEVLDRQRPELAGFLLDVSVLPELDAPRCMQVSGNPAAAALLEEIERGGLLSVVLDAPVPVLRLHDLFRDALQERLRQRDPARLRNLRRRAAASEPDPLRRIAMLIAAEDLEEAARLVLAEVPERLARAGPASVLHLLHSFPAEFRDNSPELLLVRGLAGWVGWEFALMLELFERARRAFEAAGNAAGANLASTYAAHGLVMAGHLDEARQLLDALAGRTLPLATRALYLNAAYWLAIDEGRTGDVASIYREQLELLQRSTGVALAYQTSPPLRLPGMPGVLRNLERHAGWLLRIGGDEPTPLRPLGILSQAWVATWRGELRLAHQLREQARAEAAWSGGSGAVQAHLLTHAAISLAMSGDRDGAIAAARSRFELQRQSGAWTSYIVAALVARACAAADDASALRGALDTARELAGRARAEGLPVNDLLLVPATGQLAWMEGRTADAQAAWIQALADAPAIDVYGQAAETRVRLARALLRRGDLPGAAAVLQPALAAARTEQCPGGALLAGEALCELATASWGTSLPAADAGLLREWKRMVEAVEPAGPANESGLTGREMEVLARIAAGESNKLIARGLDLSLHTVKRHVANILAKLEASSRGQAAALYSSLRR